MERIELSTKSGILNVRYRNNLWKTMKLEPLNLTWNSELGCYQTMASRALEVIKHVHKIGAYTRLSIPLQQELGLTQFGYTDIDIESEQEYWNNHRSFSLTLPADVNTNGLNITDPAYPKNYQYAAEEIIRSHDYRCLLADEMGVGKSLTIALCIARLENELPAVIIAPKSTLFQWKGELLSIISFLSDENIAVLEELTDRPSGKVTICTYNYAVENTDILKEYLMLDGFVAVDEAQTCRNMNTSVGRMFIDLAHFVDKFVPLTGSPMMQYVKELYTYLHALDPVRWNDYYAFTERYCEGHWIQINNKQKVWWDLGASNLEELLLILRNDYMLRRLKSDALPELPKKTRTIHNLGSTEPDNLLDNYYSIIERIATPILIENRFQLLDSIKEIKAALKNSQEIPQKFKPINGTLSTTSDSYIFKLYELVAFNKLDQVIAKAAEELEKDPNAKFLFFFQHKTVLNEFKRRLNALHSTKKSITITGQLSAKKREEQRLEFQNKNNVNFAYLTIGSAYAGLNFTKATHEWMIQMPWSANTAFQCEDRGYRLGTVIPPDIRYFIGKNKFEHRQLEILNRTADSSSSLLDGVKGLKFDDTSLQETDEDKYNMESAFISVLRTINNRLIEQYLS